MLSLCKKKKKSARLTTTSSSSLSNDAFKLEPEHKKKSVTFSIMFPLLFSLYLKSSFTSMVKTGTSPRYSKSILGVRRHKHWGNTQRTASFLGFQTFSRISEVNLNKSLHCSLHCPVLQPALMLKVELLQVLQRDLLLLLPAPQVEPL